MIRESWLGSGAFWFSYQWRAGSDVAWKLPSCQGHFCGTYLPFLIQFVMIVGIVYPMSYIGVFSDKILCKQNGKKTKECEEREWYVI